MARRTGFRRSPPAGRSLSALDRQIGAGPVLVRHASPSAAAVGDRRLPEADLVEIVDAIGLAASVAEERVALAGCRHHGNAAEPGGEVTLELGRKGMLQPHVGAVR